MVKSCNSLLCLLPICIFSYLKSVLRYKFLIFFTYHLDNLYLCEIGCGVHGYFSQTKEVRVPKVQETQLQGEGFYRPTVNKKFIFTGIVKFIDIQKCAVQTLAVTPTCRNITWSTEWFVLTADSNETYFGGVGIIIIDFQVASLIEQLLCKNEYCVCKLLYLKH